jgi:tRNA(fMet)-specific endonuclease VapC
MIDCSVDSVALIDLLRNEPKVISALSDFSEIGISHVVLGELILGALKSGNQDELRRTFALVEGMTLLHADNTTSLIYALIRRDLEQRGTPIPQNDLWIAAVSIQANVPLITRDHHFSRIPELQVLDY